MSSHSRSSMRGFKLTHSDNAAAAKTCSFPRSVLRAAWGYGPSCSATRSAEQAKRRTHGTVSSRAWDLRDNHEQSI